MPHEPSQRWHYIHQTSFSALSPAHQQNNNIMGRPAPQTIHKVDMSHQEMERLLSELEQWYSSAGAEWIMAEAAASWLRNDLGACEIGRAHV